MTDPEAAISKELREVLVRINHRGFSVERDRSPLLTLGDRCYASGLAFALGAMSGLSRDDVLKQFDGMFVIEGAPKPKKKTLARKKKTLTRSKK